MPKRIAKDLAMLCVLWAPLAAAGEEEEAPPPKIEGERPRIRYWLGDDAGTPAEEGARPGPAAEVIKADNVELVVPQEGDRLDPHLRGSTYEERIERLQDAFKAQHRKAMDAYEAKDYVNCVRICRNVLTADPRNEKAMELMRKAYGKLAEADARLTRMAAEKKDQEAILESEEHSVRPPQRLREVRPAWPRREDDPRLPGREAMLKQIDQKVTVDFMKADLDWVFNTLFILTGINIIADPAAIEGKSLTLHVDKIPLREVLDFIVRNNDGIQYSVTEHAVWITASSADDLTKIFVPRVYPLHHGLVSTTPNQNAGAGQRSNTTGRANIPGGGGGGGGGPGGAPGGAGGAGAQQPEQPSYLEEILQYLVDNPDTQTFPEGSHWWIDRPSNQLIVFTTPSGHEAVRELLDKFDQPPIQVLIKARFLDVAMEKNSSLGVNIDSIATRVGSNNIALEYNNPGAGTDVGTPTSLFGALGSGMISTITGTRTDPTFRATINALLNHRNTRILSEPQILAVNNKESAIDVTTHFSYITDLEPVTATQFGGNGTATSSVVAFVPNFDEEQIGFTLVVTPSVGRDLKTINLHIRPVIDSLAQGQSITQFQNFDVGQVDQNGIFVPPVIQRPTIDQTSLETDVVLEDNGYVIIGGLIRNRNETVERKIPGLHRIPGLGHLFKSKGEQRTTSNLMIIVEAQIVTPRGRVYHTDTWPDDPDIREGGVNRAPGQVSQTPAVRDALGLPQVKVERQETETVRSAEPPAEEVRLNTLGQWAVPVEEE